VLLRDESGACFLSQGGGRLQALPDSLGRSRLPLEITFRSDFDPVLIRGLSERGWEMLRPDGTRFVESEETPASEP
jgi:hypothetical protein